MATTSASEIDAFCEVTLIFLVIVYLYVFLFPVTEYLVISMLTDAIGDSICFSSASFVLSDNFSPFHLATDTTVSLSAS